MPGRGFASHPENINRKGRKPNEQCISFLLRQYLIDPTISKAGEIPQDKMAKDIVLIAADLHPVYKDIPLKDRLLYITYITDRVEGKPLQQIQAQVEKLVRVGDAPDKEDVDWDKAEE